METIVLIRDKFENDFGFLEEGVAKEAAAEIDFAHILVEHHPRAIYTWGVKRESSAKKCDLVFDVTLFFTRIRDRSHLSKLSGRDPEIQESILRHPRCLELMNTIVSTINDRQPDKIAFVCNYGKHRSVGWAELVRKHFYIDTTIDHLHLT